MEQRFTFDQAAGVYGKARPDYPDALVDDVVSYAELKPTDRIFEVGCGTGQATKGFARRGFAILATDPGAAMIRGAREILADFGNVEYLETAFEEWAVERAAFRLIIAVAGGAVFESRRGAVARRLAGGVRPCSGGTAGAIARQVQANLSPSDRQMGPAARGLVPAKRPVQSMV
jgi:SAM-dependent methyltransferase